MSISSRRRGVTLVETAVVAGITAAMVGLLLPALSSAIATAQSSTCRNNLARLAAGLSAYHDVQGHFPASIEFPSSDPYGASDGNPNNLNWILRILPYIGEQSLYDSFDFVHGLAGYNSTTGLPYNGTSLAAGDPIRGTTTVISGLQCPADALNGANYQLQIKFIGQNHNPQPNQYQLWARGNYGANACMAFPYAYASSMQNSGADACGNSTQEGWTGPYSWRTRGVMGANVGLSRTQITDGTSTTILIGELRSGLNYDDPRGTWSVGMPAASSAWRQGMQPPNNCSGGDYFGVLGIPVLTLLGGGSSSADINLGHQLAQQQCMGIVGEADRTTAMNTGLFRSQHSGGILVAMCDGSVRFISDSVEHGNLGGYWPLDAGLNGNPDYNVLPQFLTWERLNASGDSLVVDQTTDANFSSTVTPFVLGDMNGDGVMDNFDIPAMELALADPAAYLAMYPNLTDYQQRGDINQDGSFDNLDIGAFEAILAGTN